MTTCLQIIELRILHRKKDSMVVYFPENLNVANHVTQNYVYLIQYNKATTAISYVFLNVINFNCYAYTDVNPK